MLSTVGSRELKNRLGTYLQRVRKGETLRITDRGEPVAELRPIQTDDGSLEARLERMALEGLITPAKRKVFKPFPRLRAVIQGPSLSETVIADREDRF